jgi:hypothetical protein
MIKRITLINHRRPRFRSARFLIPDCRVMRSLIKMHARLKIVLLFEDTSNQEPYCDGKVLFLRVPQRAF